MNAPHVARVLIADDEPSIRFVLRETLEEQGFDVVEVADGEAALEQLSNGDFQLGFVDIRMPGLTGLEVLERLPAGPSEPSIVIITAQNTFENAVEAMKRGALDYLVKPFGIAEVKALAEKALRTRALEREVRELRRAVDQHTAHGEQLVGKSPAILEIFKTIGRVAARDISVLVTGDSGTGKELVARAIHTASGRAEHPFVAVNTAAIPRELLESELFGHERGAFTGAIAARKGRFREATGGTLFLDEIGDMPIDLQAKLLRVLQSGEVTPVGGQQAVSVDVRIVAATHRDLDVAVAAGNFREDLLYRLRVVPIQIPKLADRGEDVRILAEHFVSRYADELSDGNPFLTEETIDFLAEYQWPGNVRELENAIKRALVLSSGDVLQTEDFEFLLGDARPAEPGSDLTKLVEADVLEALGQPEPCDIYRSVLERVERPLLASVLSHTEGNQIRAAALLGINRNTLRKKIVDFGIEVPGRK
ncbi:MAG: sigma-54-dependent Fis family transcriptional regulator [Deltaproteobacteria bacterium]|nr:sigma-54-dependent Fis family transcriptional regulator [Deltaproteobacteria bacterium]MBW2397757.1 sigma-54-dependent Fis family transcriptional regulator [Deltaproteobacteria bacterium]